MAEAWLRFGCQSSSDVKMFLTGPEDEDYVRNPVHLHSQILKRLKYFEGRFSNRRSSDNSMEIWVRTPHKFDHYLKCIEILYGEDVDFPNIEECLAILSVASEMLADESITKCMQYLEAVSWSAEQESQIREALSSEGLKLKILPDLAARLHQDDDDDHLNVDENIIQEMALLIGTSNSRLSRNQERVEKYLEGILHRNTSRDVVDVCGRVLLKHFESLVDCRYLSTLQRVFKLIQHCKGGILEAALKAFCEDAKFVESVKEEYYKFKTAELVFNIIMWFMKATGDGKIIISRASRVSFLTTWLPIIGNFRIHKSLEDEFEEFDKAVLKVVESLPQVDQKRMCVVWAKVYREKVIDIATPYTLADLLLV